MPRIGLPELFVVFLLVLLLFGRRRKPRPPGRHPIPANDEWFLTRLATRTALYGI